MEYVDVRGPHPTYVRDSFGTVLRNAPRGITVEEARRLVEERP